MIAILAYDAIVQGDWSLHVVPGSTIDYRLSDGTHTIAGSDLHAAFVGWHHGG